ncbi:hypothetical protein M0Q03_01080, partial [bacterium]|nr:hypothetical protein [bacterium]
MNSPLKIIKSFCLLFFSFFFLISFAEAATCGSANGTSTPAAPTTNLCSDGSLPHVDISGNSWAWTCGTTPCRAIDINAAYKSQFNATEMPTYTGSGSSPTTADIWLQYFCFSGFPTGLIAYQQYDLVSCSYGTMGSHGGCTSCVMSKYTIRKKGPTNGSCGSANGKNYAYNITSYGSDTQCASGTSTNTAFPAQGSSTSWTCSGSNGGSSANCSARRAAAPVNGRCGSSSNFCTAGTLLDTTDTAQNYTWTCLGLNGGANASCSIPK